MLLRQRFALVPALCLVAFGLASSAGAEDWPQWKGPERNGLSQETGLLKEWPEGGPKQVWMTDQGGLGYAGPAIVDGKLYTLGALDGVAHLLAFDANTGERLWATEIGEDFDNAWGDGPRSTPSVEGDLVWAMAGRGTLICCKIADGSEVWRVEMTDLGGKVPEWGYAESPLVDGDKILCTPGGAEGAIAALDKKSGKVLWRSKELGDAAHYSSVVKMPRQRRDLYVQLLPERVVGIDAANGAVQWQLPWPGRVAVIPTPLVEGDRVYITAGYNAGCRLFEVGGRGDEVTGEVFENKLMKNKHDGFVLVDGHIYGYSDGVGWVCQNWDTGELVWRERSKLGKGSVAYADGRLYCLEEDTGTVALVEATPEGWSEHGRFELEPQSEQRSARGRIWVHPVISGGKLFLRDQEYLYAFDIKAD